MKDWKKIEYLRRRNSCQFIYQIFNVKLNQSAKGVYIDGELIEIFDIE